MADRSVPAAPDPPDPALAEPNPADPDRAELDPAAFPAAAPGPGPAARPTASTPEKAQAMSDSTPKPTTSATNRRRQYVADRGARVVELPDAFGPIRSVCNWLRPSAGRPAGQRDNGLVIEVAPDQFEEMVAEALDGLPAELGQMMQNVAVTVQHEPGPPGLLGLYQGIPLTSRASNYAGVLPDRITIYHQAICAVSGTAADVVEQVRRTVIHEVGHYFGLDDQRLHELGW